jgi:hypothetical protein
MKRWYALALALLLIASALVPVLVASPAAADDVSLPELGGSGDEEDVGRSKAYDSNARERIGIYSTFPGGDTATGLRATLSWQRPTLRRASIGNFLGYNMNIMMLYEPDIAGCSGTHTGAWLAMMVGVQEDTFEDAQGVPKTIVYLEWHHRCGGTSYSWFKNITPHIPYQYRIHYNNSEQVWEFWARFKDPNDPNHPLFDYHFTNQDQSAAHLGNNHGSVTGLTKYMIVGESYPPYPEVASSPPGEAVGMPCDDMSFIRDIEWRSGGTWHEFSSTVPLGTLFDTGDDYWGAKGYHGDHPNWDSWMEYCTEY